MLIVFLALLVLAVFWVVGVYNRLISLKAHADEGWSGIDVQLKRRYDLVPNLMETVKGYKIHEQNVLEEVTRMRNLVGGAQNQKDQLGAEQGLTAALKSLFAVVENYPDLKANQNFMDLQTKLAELESEIQLSRRYYNGTAREFNIATQTFPSNLIAKQFSFEKLPYFEADSDEKQNVRVQF